MTKKRPDHPLGIGIRVRSRRSPPFNSRWYWHGTGTVLFADDYEALVIKDGHEQEEKADP